jgi:branched-chain amino acid transport system substrate-binding protein
MKKPWIVASAVALPLMLSACGGSTPPGASSGGGNGGGGGSSKTIVIGSVHPLSGSSAADGQQMDNAAKLAVDDINAAGGIKCLDGAQLKLDSADSQGKPEVGQSEAQRLIQGGAAALLGTYQSAVSQNVAAVAERNKVPFVIDVSSADQILQQGYKYTFRLQPSGTVLAEKGAEFLSDLSKEAGAPAKTIAILNEQGPFGTAIAKTFTEKAKSLGMNVGQQISYDPANVSDFTTQMTAIKQSGADVLMVAGYYRDGVLAAKAVSTVKPPLNAVWGVANGAFDTPQFPGEVGAAGNGFFDVNYRLDSTNPVTKKVVDAYKAKYGEDVRTAAVLSYDGVRVIADALGRACDTEPTKLRDAISKTEIAPLLAQDGPIKFTDTGENQNATPIVMQVQDGQTKQVFPAGSAETKPTYPASPGQ